jgi:hypothetical protein
MPLASLLKRLVAPLDRRHLAPNRALPRLEALEDRTLPSGFFPGSISFQDGWSGGSTGPVDPTVDQTVDQSGANAFAGMGAWRVSNSTVNGNHNGAFNGWPFSPGLSVVAGQPSSGAGADQFNATVFFKSASATADGSNIEVDLGSSAGDDRNNFLAITNEADANGGLQLRADEPDGATGNFKPTVSIATNLSRTAYHRIDIVARFFNGNANDTFQVTLDGKVLTNPATGGTTFGTFEGFRNGTGSPYVLTNRLFFRSGAAPSAFGAFTDTAAKGFFFDNVSYQAVLQSNPNVALAAYSATFERVGITPAALPPGQVGAAYSQMLTGSGGQAPYTFSVTAGALPPGLTLASNGTLTGTPTAAGTFTFTATATDSTSPTPFTDSQGYTLVVTPAAPVPPVPPVPPAPSTPAIFAVGAGPGGLPVVNVYDAATGAFKFQFQAFEAGFTGGTRVAVARSNGQDFVAVAAGPGGFLVRTFAVSGTSARPVGQFTPFGTFTNGAYSGFTGGIYVALGDLRGDGQLEVVTAPDAAANSSPFFDVWNLAGTQQLSPNVFAFEQGFTGGVRVAVGDVDGSGKNEIIAAAGPGGFPFVDVINGQTFAMVRRFQAFDTGFMGGVTVATGALDASGMARILVGADSGDNSPGNEPVMRTFDNNGNLLTGPVFAFEQSYHGGVNVGTTLDGRSRAWVLATPARAHNPQVNVFSANFTLLQNQTITDTRTNSPDANFANGASVGG